MYIFAGRNEKIMAAKTNYDKNGRQYYRVTATVAKDATGKAIRKEFYGKSKKDAETKKDTYLQALKSGLNVDHQEILLRDLMKTWLFEVLFISDKIKPSTFDRYEGIYRNYIVNSELAHLKVYSIKSIHLQRHYNYLFDHGKPASILKNLNKLLKTFFNYAIAEDYLLKNPCMNIVFPSDSVSTKETDIIPLSDEEIERIKQVVKDTNLEAFFMTALGSGMRVGELLALTKKDIDFGNAEIHVDKSIKCVKDIKKDGTYTYKTIVQVPKTKNSIRNIQIPPNLNVYLKKYIALQKEKYLKNGLPFTEDSLIFTTESCNYLDNKNLRRSWERALRRADVPYRNLHNIRHTYATKLFEKEVPLKTVQMLLGHSNISITADIYTHVIPKEKVKAVDRLNELFL